MCETTPPLPAAVADVERLKLHSSIDTREVRKRLLAVE